MEEGPVQKKAAAGVHGCSQRRVRRREEGRKEGWKGGKSGDGGNLTLPP